MLQKISYLINLNNQFLCRQTDQRPLINAELPLNITGVIYAIIHLPSNKVYVGQTINSSYCRFKQQGDAPRNHHENKTTI